jgi:hypothetical protein
MIDYDKFRSALHNLLNIRCIFPASDQDFPTDENEIGLQTKTNFFVARCMKEKTDNSPMKDFIEDIVTRIRVLSEKEEDKTYIIEVDSLFALFVHFCDLFFFF